MRYGWTHSQLPSHSICGSSLTVECSLNCKCCSFPSTRRNEICNVAASLLTETCHNVAIEPHLQQLTGEVLPHLSANCENLAQVDITATGVLDFWSGSLLCCESLQPLIKCYIKAPLWECHRNNQIEKRIRRSYEERITSIKHKSFFPLVVTTAGGLGPAATVFFESLATMISELHNQPYSRILHWI